jgi:Arc/MetJ-type ribon-helix-helix transcriptional regulator
MARAKTVGFAIPEDMLPDLEIVINEFAGGNRSEFLRVAVRHFRSHMMAERMKSIRAQLREERGGRTYTNAEVMALVREAKGKAPLEE